MGFLYRYIDLEDNIIKYVGIVKHGNKIGKLKNRIYTHHSLDEWAKNGQWKIEYLKRDIQSRTDVECLEAHYIALYGTDKYYNQRKSGWGLCSFVDSTDDEWIELEYIPKSIKKPKRLTAAEVKDYLEECFLEGKMFPRVEDRQPMIEKLNFRDKNSHVLKSKDSLNTRLEELDIPYRIVVKNKIIHLPKMGKLRCRSLWEIEKIDKENVPGSAI